jgi:hypothetical protein
VSAPDVPEPPAAFDLPMRRAVGAADVAGTIIAALDEQRPMMRSAVGAADVA